MPRPRPGRAPELVTARQAIERVQSGQTLAVGGSNAEPTALVQELCAQGARLREIRAWTWPGGFPTALADARLHDHLELRLSVPNGWTVDAIAGGYAQYVPGHLSSQLRRIATGEERVDGALVMTTPPDADGWCSLGTSVVNMRPLCEAADYVVAQFNDRMPRTRGQSTIHVSQIDAAVVHAQDLPELIRAEPGESDLAIARHAAALIKDGSTIQCGIGAMPDAVLGALQGHRELAIRSGIIGDSVTDLACSGALRAAGAGNAPIITGSVLGTRALYAFVDNNPLVELHDGRTTHDVLSIAACPRFVAINSAIEIDLTGQVNAEEVGGRQVAGVGGQSDFVRGAQLSDGGRNLLVLRSTARQGTRSRIVPALRPGAPVSLPRSDVEWVVTEHGAVSLAGLSLAERRQALLSIADPAHVDELARTAPTTMAGVSA